MNEMGHILFKLDQCHKDCEQIGREIYYAMSYIPLDNVARANLKQALMYLGVHSYVPEDVGLSKSVYRGD